MPPKALILGALALAALLPVASMRAEPRVDPLQDLLRRAGAWVQRFAEDSTSVVAEERYEQEYRVKDDGGARIERRSLVSEVVLVAAPEDQAKRGYPWVQFRDAIEVDGRELPEHRGRLERLFKDASAASYARARALIEESARYNIGPLVREINVPSFALFFLYPGNQGRVRFERVGVETAGDARTDIVTFRERQRPTLIRSATHEDRPAHGTVWIDDATGRVLKTDLQVDPDRHWATQVEVTYALDARLDAWVPMSMHERHQRSRDEYVDCTARYSNYRRFVTSGRMIVPK